MPKQTTLVNQKSDDVPFGDEQNGDSTAPAAAQDQDVGITSEELLRTAEQRILELEEDNASAEDEILKLKQEVEQYKADPGDEPNIKLLCFLAILQGQAAKGELSIGAVKGDEAVRLQMKHAAGMASFAEIAAKKL